MLKIAVLGCGWLGLPLAKALIAEGFAVKGSTTSMHKLAILLEAGIIPFAVSVNANSIDGSIEDFLEGNDVLIIDIPPKLRGENKEPFTDKIRTLMPYIEASAIGKVIFVSSTAVYADDNTVVTEATHPKPETESGKQLLEAEAALGGNMHFKTTILRFGGLTGADRQPVKYLAGKENLENPDGPVNLIHQQDCIGIILAVIKKRVWGETFNAVAPFHPTREDYYTGQAAGMGLPLPRFNREKESVGKVISSNKVIAVLGYTFMGA
jgi:nucleoside-diphosphate-sugar epimerase